MTAIDVERILQPVSADRRCGDDLEYDPAFGELERMARGKPEQQIGDSVVAAEAPDWRKVRDGAMTLLARTKDLRVGVYLARALLHTDGIAGLGAGLAVLHGMVERFWEDVHPRLDPSDGNDPTMRVNSVVTLRDADAFLLPLREAPLVSSRALGRFSLRDVQIVTGAASAAAGQAAPDAASVEGAFKEVPVEELQSVANALDTAITKARAIETAFTARLDGKGTGGGRPGTGPNLDPLVDLLAAARNVVNERLGRRGVGGAASTAASAADGASATRAASAPGEIASREDAMRSLDRICDWFIRNEPSSPVPLLLSRAKRLVAKSFLDILKDMAPDGFAQAAIVGGVATEDRSQSGE